MAFKICVSAFLAMLVVATSTAHEDHRNNSYDDSTEKGQQISHAIYTRKNEMIGYKFQTRNNRDPKLKGEIKKAPLRSRLLGSTIHFESELKNDGPTKTISIPYELNVRRFQHYGRPNDDDILRKEKIWINSLGPYEVKKLNISLQPRDYLSRTEKDYKFSVTLTVMDPRIKGYRRLYNLANHFELMPPTVNIKVENIRRPNNRRNPNKAYRIATIKAEFPNPFPYHLENIKYSIKTFSDKARSQPIRGSIRTVKGAQIVKIQKDVEIMRKGPTTIIVNIISDQLKRVQGNTIVFIQ